MRTADIPRRKFNLCFSFREWEEIKEKENTLVSTRGVYFPEKLFPLSLENKFFLRTQKFFRVFKISGKKLLKRMKKLKNH